MTLFDLRIPWLTLTLAGLTVALFAALGPAPVDWVFDRAAIADGEWWRLLSGHWVHSDGAHLGWNLAALILLGALIETDRRRLLLAGLFGGSLAVDIAVWTLLPDMSHYCGLSGVLNTLLLLALGTLHGRSSSALLISVAAFSLLKIVVELFAGHALLTDTAWTSVPLAHLAGWTLGVMIVATVGPGSQHTRPA